MKKVRCFVFVSFFLLIIASCGQSQADNNSILGYWEAETKSSLLGVSESGDEEKQTINMNVAFTYYILEGDKLELTYEDGNIQAFTVSFSGENLILDGRAHLELV